MDRPYFIAMIVRWGLVAGFMLLVSPAIAEDKKADDKVAKVKKALSGPEKKAEAAIRNMLNGAGRAIDGCTGRYLKEQSGAKGSARIDVTVDKEGRAQDPSVTTSLPQARTLRLCLEALARDWTFPKPRQATSFGLTVPVAPGVRFRVPAPGEKRAETKKPEKREGFLQLSPGSFRPGFGRPPPK